MKLNKIAAEIAFLAQTATPPVEPSPEWRRMGTALREWKEANCGYGIKLVVSGPEYGDAAMAQFTQILTYWITINGKARPVSSGELIHTINLDEPVVEQLEQMLKDMAEANSVSGQSQFTLEREAKLAEILAEKAQA